MDSDFQPVLGGVSALILRDGKILLVRRGLEPYRNRWSLPGGGVERGERLRDAVRREVLEETGLEVEAGSVAGYSEQIAGDEHFIVIAFHTRVLGGELRAGDDADEAEFVDPGEIHRRPTTPGLEDVFRGAGLLQ